MIKLYVTDCEGPIVLNDNAFEICQHFLPEGDKFFRQISLYDDYLAEIEKKPGYQAGTTLALILPFLKAYEVTEEDIQDYSRKHLKLVPDAKETLQNIQEIMPVFLISTSYSPFIDAVCERLEFPKEQAFSSQISLDRYEFSKEEVEFLRTSFDSVLKLPQIQFSRGLTERTREAILDLNNLFWKKLSKRASGKLIENAKIVGAEEKAKIVRKLARDFKFELSEIAYVGDSITDVPAFRTVKEGNGISISFNGNSWAIEAADYAVTSENARAVYHLLAILKQEQTRIFKKEQDEALVFIEESEKMRQFLRGKAGELG